MDLDIEACVPCKGGIPPLSDEEILSLKGEVPDWNINKIEDIRILEKEFLFTNFVKAMGFVTELGLIAEKQGHHPVMTISYNKVKVSWWTHKIKGLHRNDFIMAAWTNRLV